MICLLRDIEEFLQLLFVFLNLALVEKTAPIMKTKVYQKLYLEVVFMKNEKRLGNEGNNVYKFIACMERDLKDNELDILIDIIENYDINNFDELFGFAKFMFACCRIGEAECIKLVLAEYCNILKNGENDD